MASRLSSDDFGLKIYNKFPPSYREDDILNHYALKRYLEAAGEGFKPVIEEQNGLLDLHNPQTCSEEVLFLLYQQYGLEMFHGIPVPFLRAFLPSLSTAYSKKGSFEIIDFITSTLSGVRCSTEYEYDLSKNPNVMVRLEMDYGVTDYFPNTSQFKRILTKFIPFWCDIAIKYVYYYNTTINLLAKESHDIMRIIRFENALFDKEVDTYKDTFKWSDNLLETGTFVNHPLGFFTNDYHSLINGNRLLYVYPVFSEFDIDFLKVTVMENAPLHVEDKMIEKSTLNPVDDEADIEAIDKEVDTYKHIDSDVVMMTDKYMPFIANRTPLNVHRLLPNGVLINVEEFNITMHEDEILQGDDKVIDKYGTAPVEEECNITDDDIEFPTLLFGSEDCGNISAKTDEDCGFILNSTLINEGLLSRYSDCSIITKNNGEREVIYT